MGLILFDLVSQEWSFAGIFFYFIVKKGIRFLGEDFVLKRAMNFKFKQK